MPKEQKESQRSSVMGRPTLPIVGEVIEKRPPEVDAKKQLVTVRAQITSGPSHVRKTDNGSNREVDIQIPLATVQEISSMAHLQPAGATSNGKQKEVVLPKRPPARQPTEAVAVKIFEVIDGSREISEVHTAGCPAARSHADQKPHEAEVASRDEVREMIYPHELFEYDPSDAATVALYMEDISFHACVSKKLSP